MLAETVRCTKVPVPTREGLKVLFVTFIYDMCNEAKVLSNGNFVESHEVNYFFLSLLDRASS